jgi:hypothetical protein
MLNIDLTQPSSAAFSLDIIGSNQEPSIIAFVEQDDYIAGFKCMKSNQNEFEIKFDRLGGMFNPGPASFYIQVILNGRYFIPFRSDANLVGVQVQNAKDSIEQIAVEIKPEVELPKPQNPVENNRPTQPLNLISSADKIARAPERAPERAPVRKEVKKEKIKFELKRLGEDTVLMKS